MHRTGEISQKKITYAKANIKKTEKVTAGSYKKLNIYIYWDRAASDKKTSKKYVWSERSRNKCL